MIELWVGSCMDLANVLGYKHSKTCWQHNNNTIASMTMVVILVQHLNIQYNIEIFIACSTQLLNEKIDFPSEGRYTFLLL